MANRKPVGWPGESGRHSLASRGIETPKSKRPGSFGHKLLHKALAETLTELRRNGVTSLDNLEFYNLVRERENKPNKDNNKTIASYLRTHGKEFGIRYEEYTDKRMRRRRISL